MSTILGDEKAKNASILPIILQLNKLFKSKEDRTPLI